VVLGLDQAVRRPRAGPSQLVQAALMTLLGGGGEDGDVPITERIDSTARITVLVEAP